MRSVSQPDPGAGTGRRARLRGRTAGACALVVLGVAAYWAARLAYADFLFRRGSLEDVRRAAQLAPGNAAYLARLAGLLEEHDPKASLRAREQALALNPRDSALWIESGLRAERDGNLPQAERRLREAARVDTTYAPRAALANYYFRRGDQERFWHWVHEALLIAAGDQAPLFRLCWSLNPEAELILRRAIPERGPVLGQYLQFLLDTGRWRAAGTVAARIVEAAQPEHTALLLACCDRLLSERDGEAARRLWDSMIGKGLLGYSPLRPESGEALTNGEFLLAPRSQGFDWRIAPAEGVAISRDQNERSLRISFSGKQPERCEPLSQITVLAPGRTHRFRYQYRTSGVAPGSGPRWRVFDFTKGEELLAESGHLSSEAWNQASLVFAAPPGLKLARLALGYERVPGTTRVEGSVFLRNLALGFER